MNIDWYKKQAKELLKHHKINHPSAVSRVAQVLVSTEDVTLMRVQHVIAVEHGFKNWHALRESIERFKDGESLP